MTKLLNLCLILLFECDCKKVVDRNEICTSSGFLELIQTQAAVSSIKMHFSHCSKQTYYCVVTEISIELRRSKDELTRSLQRIEFLHQCSKAKFTSHRGRNWCLRGGLSAIFLFFVFGQMDRLKSFTIDTPCCRIMIESLARIRRDG